MREDQVTALKLSRPARAYLQSRDDDFFVEGMMLLLDIANNPTVDNVTKFDTNYYPYFNQREYTDDRWYVRYGVNTDDSIVVYYIKLKEDLLSPPH